MTVREQNELWEEIESELFERVENNLSNFSNHDLALLTIARKLDLLEQRLLSGDGEEFEIGILPFVSDQLQELLDGGN